MKKDVPMYFLQMFLDTCAPCGVALSWSKFTPSLLSNAVFFSQRYAQFDQWLAVDFLSNSLIRWHQFIMENSKGIHHTHRLWDTAEHVPYFDIGINVSLCDDHWRDHLKLLCMTNFSSQVTIRFKKNSFWFIVSNKEQITKRCCFWFVFNSGGAESYWNVPGRLTKVHRSIQAFPERLGMDPLRLPPSDHFHRNARVFHFLEHLTDWYHYNFF